MLKKYRHISFILLICGLYLGCPIESISQIPDSINTKGMVIPKKTTNIGVTRAVLVGISNYEHEDIPDLQYADRDVEVFQDYLLSPAGGNVKAENIKLLTNELATGGNVHKALYWLVKESKENDECIIYFSGHGDVETIYPDEPGHLLVFDSPSSIYQINSLRLEDLRRIIRTLSEQKNAKVYLFADACRSGKLAGTVVSGAQATSAALAEQFSSEIKIMSCQPNEYSIEGKQWGGGRGLFSFHFVEGLMGLADMDHDAYVDLKEIQRYLEDRFEEDLVNQSQSPLILGNRNTQIAHVDEASLASLINSKADLTAGALAYVNSAPNRVSQSRGEGILAQFYQAIDQKILLQDDEYVNQRSAAFYLEQLEKHPTLAERAPLLKGDLIFALQDEAQAAINRYLEVDYQEMINRYKGVRDNYGKYAHYLSKAADLLTEMHYLYPQLKAKALYFSVVEKRLSLNTANAKSEMYEPLEDLMVQALLYDANAPYLWNELGLIFMNQSKNDKALEHFTKAIERSPTWPLPYQNRAFVFSKQGRYQQAIDASNQALELNPHFIAVYNNLSYCYLQLGEIEKSLACDLQLIDVYQDHFCSFYNDAGNKYYKLGDATSALTYFDKAIQCDASFIESYINKSIILMNQGKLSDAVEVIEMIPDSFSNQAIVWNQLGYLQNRLGQEKVAENYFLKALQLDSLSQAQVNLAMLYLSQRKADLALPYFDFYIKNINQMDEWAYFDRACAHALSGDLPNFYKDMEKAMANGFSSLNEFESSSYLEAIQESAEYQEILNNLKKK